MGKPEGKRQLGGDPGLYRRMISRWIFKKWDVGEWTGSIWFR
jgi:hypothetical protein